jgi:hypothetical protein
LRGLDPLASPAVSGLYAHAIAESGCLQQGENQRRRSTRRSWRRSSAPRMRRRSKPGIHCRRTPLSFPLGDAQSTELQYVFGKIPYRDVTPPFTVAQFALSAQMK